MCGRTLRVIYALTRAEIQRKRKEKYLEQWPIEKQLEAISEAISGRPEKQEQMLKDFTKIREALPFF